MKRSKFTDSQIMEALKRVDSGLAVPEITLHVLRRLLLKSKNWACNSKELMHEFEGKTFS